VRRKSVREKAMVLDEIEGRFLGKERREEWT